MPMLNHEINIALERLQKLPQYRLSLCGFSLNHSRKWGRTAYRRTGRQE